MFGLIEYLGKFNYRCGMCHKIEYNDKFKWRGYITKHELTICAKCAEREVGKKSWKKRSQRLKKSSQK